MEMTPGPDYPGMPGWKEGDTSRTAAEEMELRARTLRRLSYEHIKKHPYPTADRASPSFG
jgi:hypothetical protein